MIRLGLIFIFSCAFHSSFSQRINVDTVLLKAERLQYVDFPKSDSLYEIASRELVLRGIENDLVTWTSILHKRANSALIHSKLANAKKFITDSYATITRYRALLKAKSDSLKAETQQIEAAYLYYIGSYASSLTKLDSAETYLRSKEQVASRCSTLFRILQFQATIYQLQGELESSIDRNRGSIHYYDCYRSRDEYPNYIVIHRNIALAYAAMNEMAKARAHFRLAKANIDNCPAKSWNGTFERYAILLYNSMGEFYRTQNQIDSAKYYLEQALALAQRNPNFLSRVNELLAKVAISQNDYNSAQALLQKSLDYTLNSLGEKHSVTAHQYRLISNVYLETNDVTNSLIFLQKALNSLSSSNQVDPNDFRQNPPISVLSKEKRTLTTLHNKATTLQTLYRKTGSKDFLMAARSTNMLALQFVDSARNDFSLEKDKVVLGEDAVPVYATGLDIASMMYAETKAPTYLSECFQLMDESRSTVLMDHVKLVKTFAGLPPELQNRERELKVELSQAEQQLYEAEIKNRESSSYRQRLGEIKKAHATLVNDIKRLAPQYYKLRINKNSVSLDEAQRMLSENEFLVEYFLDDTVLYTLTMSAGRSAMYVAVVDSLQEKIESVTQLISQPGHSFRDATLTKNLRHLFDKLIKPWYSTAPSHAQLIIIPHHVLNYIPFEILPTNNSGNLLVNDFAVSYASSVSLLREQRDMNSRGNFFAGFNADYSNREDLPPLTGAVSEVVSIKDIFGFRSSLFSPASAEDFRKEASGYKVLHLALHSIVNDEKPMFSRLVFTQTDSLSADITANELYSMDLNADVAVLSACETGLGKLHRGEGMMSMSRAFMYAGVPSTVISLWKVPDQSASILMTNFYHFLKNGEKKDEALRLAKLEFLEQHPEMSHPFFWAGFVVNGKTDPILLSNFTDEETLVAGIASVIIVTIFFIARRRRKKIIAATA